MSLLLRTEVSFTPPKPPTSISTSRGPFEKKEVYLHLYLHYTPSGPDSNETEVVNHEFPKSFGAVVINDWPLYDGFGPRAKLFARAQGLHIQAGMRTQNWYNSFTIVFEDARLKGSSLQVMVPAIDKGQWAVVGGTGDLAMARGIIYKKNPQKIGRTMVIVLDIHAFCMSQAIIVKWKLRGPSQGSTKDMVDVNGVSRIIEIWIKHNSYGIDSIEVKFERHGREESTGVWGAQGHGGGETKITLQPNEYITCVAGGIGYVHDTIMVRSLTFVTNLSTHGPVGSSFQGQVPFKMSSGLGFGGRIVGFHARAGRFLYAIGVYVKEVSSISAENAEEEDAMVSNLMISDYTIFS